MEITEKQIGNRKVRIVFFDKHLFSKDYFLQKIMKKNIYFDYIVTTQSRGYYRNVDRHIYTNNFREIINEENYFSYEGLIKDFETSKKYKLEKREHKLKRILKTKTNKETKILT